MAEGTYLSALGEGVGQNTPDRKVYWRSSAWSRTRLVLILAIAGVVATAWAIMAASPWLIALLSLDALGVAVFAFARWKVSQALTEERLLKMGAPLFVAAPALTTTQLRQLPPDRRTPPDYVLERPDSDFAASYRILSQIGVRTAKQGAPIIAVTGALAADGGAQEALTLLRTLAVEGRRVVGVDCDVALAGMSRASGVEARNGVWEVLDGKVSVRDALTGDPRSHASIIAATSGGDDPRALFEHEAFDRMLAELHSAFDFVILSCPSVLGRAITPLITRRASLCVLVVRRTKSSPKTVRAALRALKRFHADLPTGVLLTGADPDPGGERIER